MTTIFTRLVKSRSTPPEKKVTVDPAQLLLDWLQKWPKPTVRATDILIYGPRSTRKQKDADDATEILVQHGWLAPPQTTATHRPELADHPEKYCSPTIRRLA